ncbi:SHUGOSHIN 1 isoform X3 [Rhodamnia argentea]|uniref:SHUGOSHIN 1 isoform X3 n=1 Tax=Rhodamnia argentea TaxID=178133 RepID=A0A8B8NEF4_9MYRT|nr:SHUGOSHIN 1 isoform X3 [Rhodamnia argentea]
MHLVSPFLPSFVHLHFFCLQSHRLFACSHFSRLLKKNPRVSASPLVFIKITREGIASSSDSERFRARFGFQLFLTGSYLARAVASPWIPLGEWRTKMKGERTVKRASFGLAPRKALSDITNSPLRAKAPCNDGKQLQLSPATRDYVNQLLEEKMALIKVIEERNKMIELSGAELQKLRISYQKIQLQNWNLAQTNSQMLAELQSGREKLRILQHELVCKDTVIKAKNLELQGKEQVNCQKKGEKIKEEEEKEATESLPKPDDRAKPCNRDRKRGQKSRSMVPFSTSKQDGKKEKVENKRRCTRRHSARFESQEPEPPENLFEIETAQFPISKPFDNNEDTEAAPTLFLSSSSNSGGVREDDCASGVEEKPSRKSSIGRPSRRAAEKVQSYKEIPLNIKMRRSG